MSERDLFAPDAISGTPESDDLDAVAVKPKAKKSGNSPTKLSLDELRKRGCVAAVVEHWNAWARIRSDLFGFIDVLALSPTGETIAVQACRRADVATRVNKIAEAEALAAVRRCGWRILVWGWDKGPDQRYRLREVDVS